MPNAQNNVVSLNKVFFSFAESRKLVPTAGVSATTDPAREGRQSDGSISEQRIIRESQEPRQDAQPVRPLLPLPARGRGR